MTAHKILLLLACIALWACGGSSSSPAASPTASSPSPPAIATTAPSSAVIVLHETPDDLGCDSIGIDYRTMTFHIDPAAAEQVSAMTDTGVSLVTYWPEGFNAREHAVRDPAGVVVVTDGDVLEGGQQLHGYDVCLAPTKLYVMLARTGG